MRGEGGISNTEQGTSNDEVYLATEITSSLIIPCSMFVILNVFLLPNEIRKKIGSGIYRNLTRSGDLI